MKFLVGGVWQSDGFVRREQEMCGGRDRTNKVNRVENRGNKEERSGVKWKGKEGLEEEGKEGLFA